MNLPDDPLPADLLVRIAKLKEVFGLDPERQLDEFREYIRFERELRAEHVRDDAVFTAAQLNDLLDRLAGAERWMARYAPALEALARNTRPYPANIPLNSKEDDQ